MSRRDPAAGSRDAEEGPGDDGERNGERAVRTDGSGDVGASRLGRFAADLHARPRRVGLYLVLIGLVGFYLAPLETGLITAFKTQSAFTETSPFAPPPFGGLTVDPWLTAWNRLAYALANSALFAIPATIASATLGSLTAYGLTHIRWRGQVAVMALFLAGVFIPYQAVLVPLTQLWGFIDLTNLLAPLPIVANYVDLIELMITHTAYGIPICTVLFRSYYQSFNEDMLEAARLDGASVFGVYRRIVLPLSKPMFAVAFIFQFTQVWNDLLFALVLITTPSNGVVTIALNQLSGSFVQQYNLQMAGAFLAALPTLLVYILFTEQFAEGVAGRTT
ncbi:carbohydrate ABC transporter permease [Halobacteriales archaeon QS_3_64_16]|nr:MAG: carbohydrate ABC transporter permease [Halobacteriales archaeon QS_3_64_16]